MTAVGIVGPGRAGVGLGLALFRVGHCVFIHGQRSKDLPVPLELTWGGSPPWLAAVDVVLLAVPDDALSGAVRDLCRSGNVRAAHTVLHLSGVLDRSVLEALAPTGAALGSLHPLQSLSDPLRAPERLKGAVAAVEGDARAVEVASGLARTLGLKPIELPSAHKARYHTAAVFASNYLIVLGAVAEGLLREVGFSAEDARQALAPLVQGTLGNLRAQGSGALTGPVARGDAETIRRHLAALTTEQATLYRALGRVALAIADLPVEKRRAVERALS